MEDAVDILFDARHLRASGIGSYTKTCLQALSRLAAEDGRVCAVIIRPADIDSLPGNLRSHIRSSNAAMYAPSEQVMWHRALQSVKPELAWFAHYPVPVLARRQKSIVTIYDLLHAAPPQVGGPGGFRRIYCRGMVSATARGNARILTISEFTKRELERSYPRLQGRIAVTQMEVAPEWFEPAGDPARQGLAPYFIFVGNVAPQKDVGTLLRAFDGVKHTLPHDLVIVGGGMVTRTKDEAALSTASSSDRVYRMRNLPFSELRSLVAGATALVMPSLYEGLGLPPLEAMAAGTPSIVSDAPALVEGVGDAALVFHRGDADSLAEQMMLVATKEDCRDRLREAGFQRVAQRTRDRAITELLTVLRHELA